MIRKLISQKSVLTDVMVLFSAIDAARAFPPSTPRPFADTSSCLPRESRGTGEKKDSQKEVAANRNGRLIAHLGHRRVLFQQLCHNERPAIHVKALSTVVQGVHCVLAKLIDMDGDVLVLAAENNGAQCLVCLQGLRDGLATLWAQLVPGSIELRT